MRLFVGLLGIVALLAPPSAASPPASPLRVGLHVPDSVALYGPRYEGGAWESRFGARLKQELEEQLRAAFAGVELLSSFPPSQETPGLDAYLVVEQAVARFYGRGAMTAEAQATVSVFNAAREPVKDIPLSSEYVVSYTKDTQPARCDAAVQEVVRNLASQLISALLDPELQGRLQRSAEAERARRERPSAPAPPPKVFGRLVLTTTPAGATVFLDDEYWGESNAEGRLTIAGVPAGAHTLRMKMSGFKELTQAVTVVAGDNPVALQAEVAPPKPLREAEIEEALRYDLPKARLKALIAEYGVDFALTKAAELRLLDAGADKEMLELIARSKR
ncbi:MAG TPA: PEGA domain-containing protein [Terriglobales bacterium]|nr:PEGA domain-containing protein [Terriglobales bacterium]